MRLFPLYDIAYDILFRVLSPQFPSVGGTGILPVLQLKNTGEMPVACYRDSFAALRMTIGAFHTLYTEALMITHFAGEEEGTGDADQIVGRGQMAEMFPGFGQIGVNRDNGGR